MKLVWRESTKWHHIADVVKGASIEAKRPRMKHGFALPKPWTPVVFGKTLFGEDYETLEEAQAKAEEVAERLVREMASVFFASKGVETP